MGDERENNMLSKILRDYKEGKLTLSETEKLIRDLRQNENNNSDRPPWLLHEGCAYGDIRFSKEFEGIIRG